MLYSSLGRPLWIDEFLHFATAAYGSTAEAWAVIRKSTLGVNHGQTGIYMMLDFWLLKVFGADLLALRAPSLLSAGFMLYASTIFLRIRGFGLWWQCLAIFVIFCQPHLMYYAGEARPYMPLASATVGTLVYALASPEQRKKWSVRLVGVASILWGVLIHPYFSLYWFALIVFGFWLSWLNQERTFSVRSLVSYLNVPLCVGGACLYFYLASLTWLAGHPSFDRNPFEQIPQADLLRIFIWHHTEFFGFPERGMYLWAVVSTLPIVYVFSTIKVKSFLKPLLGPAGLMLLAVGLSALLSLTSYFQNYWILSRQWIASIALVALGFAWFCAEISQVLIRQCLRRQIISIQHTSKYLSILLAVLIALYGIRLNQHHLTYRFEKFVQYVEGDRSPTQPQLDGLSICPMDNHAWSALANANVAISGPVWPVFSKYYEQALGGPDVCLTSLKAY